MLFVSSIYPRAFKHDETGVSPQVRAILEAIGAAPRIGRKELADKLIVDLTADEAERMKMALASDLRWLINEGYVIEFNDGSLDLPRAKTKPKEETAEAAVSVEKSGAVEAAVSAAESKNVVAAVVSTVGENCRASVSDANFDGVSQKRPTTDEEKTVGSTESRPTEEETEIGGS
jgi:hypothetical protein